MALSGSDVLVSIIWFIDGADLKKKYVDSIEVLFSK